ncbi:HD-GYP domain-containing protein [Vibrio mangrovi]|uniref:Cyclic di-GMP phosphodiesterase response regulator RpfG n=1 Tax=Vibrio mangrovi TaxID=474394 RepID=A0A1Y6IMX9_9VIBR|nr:HD domain-containing phosphohydrolase [Vibrio mangrovi]MDW6004174.1 HD domain-containing protein [Vibrio mangrovi]SMR99029.1 Cyclic di-GMP phosphodiesterase response regulator RpfG [Vibrio mangrovi]
MEPNTTLNVDLRQMILAIETAVSLVGVDDTNHGKRVGYIASQLGQKIGLSDSDLQYVFELGMLHDCGVSTTQMHQNLVNHFNWKDAHIHCEIGYRLLKDFPPLQKFALPIRYHHTPWQELAALNLSFYDAQMANLIYLADRIDVLGAAHYESDILLACQDIHEEINRYSGSYFDPVLVDAFHKASDSEAFWIALQNRHVTRYTWDMGRLASNHMLSLNEIKHLSLILAYIVDQKSQFTAQHSVRVADVARFLGEAYGLSAEQCIRIEIAGLLHDLGKLLTPDEILEKPGPLDHIERSIINQHSYETYEILRHIQGMEEIARWAAFHHEGLNGVGYPFHPQKQELSIEARIIAVADVFQALVQNRPYREGMSLTDVLTIIDEMANDGKLDKALTGLVHQTAQQCYDIAQGSDPNGNQQHIRQFLEAPVVA